MASRPNWYSGSTPQVRWKNGRMQSESMDIIRQFDVEFPNTVQLAGCNAAERTDISNLIVSFKYIFPKQTRPSSRSAFLFYSSGQPVFRSEFEATLIKTDELLGTYDSGPFFYGEKFTAVDCCWAPFLERYAV